MNTTTIGLDIAKAVFQVHGIDARGQTTLRKRLRRAQLVSFFANLPACLVGIEACGSAHHWARELCKLGHEVKLMSPQFLKPYVKETYAITNLPHATLEWIGQARGSAVRVWNSVLVARLREPDATDQFAKAR